MEGIELKIDHGYIEGWGERSGCLHRLFCYAPTVTAGRERNDTFFARHQDALSGIQSDENFVVLGDSNTHVGSGCVDDDWWYKRGPHG